MPGAFSYGMTPANSPKGSAFQAVQPSVIPVGVIEMFAGTNAPNGWLICDGSSVSRKTYSDLFKIIGTTYGSGNSNDTFTLPDMRGRFAMGAGTGTGLNSSGSGAISGSSQTARTVGQWLGEETHLLTTAELASHSHANTVSGGSTGSMSANAAHAHTVQADGVQLGRAASGFSAVGGGYAGILIIRGNDTGSAVVNSSTNIDHTHTFTPSISNASAGSDSRHNTIPPCIVVNYIIKA